MRKKSITIALLLINFFSCGPDAFKKKSNDTTGGVSQVSLSPNSPNYIPTVLSLYYYDNGTSVEWEFPLGQVANYRVEFCSDKSFSSCSKIVQINCTGPNNCAKQTNSVGIIAIGDGRVPGRGAILYSYQPIGQTYTIRVRAESINGQSEWLSAAQCTYSLPAQCFAP